MLETLAVLFGLFNLAGLSLAGAGFVHSFRQQQKLTKVRAENIGDLLVTPKEVKEVGTFLDFIGRQNTLCEAEFSYAPGKRKIVPV